MAQTPSIMLPLGTLAPDFTLYNVLTKQQNSLQALKGKEGTVIIFMCNHCPVVRHIIDKFIEIAREYQQRGIAFIGISSNDVIHYPDDSPEKMSTMAAQKNFSFPYLYDESQDIARAYHAACTPDLYLFDSTLRCVYRGEFDNSRPGNGIAVTGSSLCDAMDALLSKQPISADQRPSLGCNIKWK